MDYRPCLCGETFPVTPLGQKNGFTVAECEICGTLRRLEYDPEYTKLYTEGDYYHNALQLEVGHETYAERFDHDLGVARSRLHKLHGQSRLLDVGCANGAFLQGAKDAGYNVWGLELNPAMARAAAERVDCPVYTDWTDLRWFSFDVITYHDVIEHVEDPQAEIRRAAEHLYYGGLLVMDTPDFDDPRWQELGMEYHHVRPEQHLWYFTERTFVPLFKKAGLTVTHVDRPIPGKLVVYARRVHA